jgi:hypothetical protein
LSDVRGSTAVRALLKKRAITATDLSGKHQHN